MKKRSVFRGIAAVTAILWGLPIPAFAQRLQDKNNVVWQTTIANISVSNKFQLVGELRLARESYLTNWQHILSRAGLQYNFTNNCSMLAGYGYIVGYSYGDYSPGPHHVPEHRIFEQLVWNESYHRFSVMHRIRLEQRFLGKVNQSVAEYSVASYNYVNRVRYMLRCNVALSNKTIQPKTWYLAAFDEVFVGFGPNVNKNIFDQNRLVVMGGYQFSNVLKLEAGVINQTLEQAALVKGKEVIQYNTGPYAVLTYTYRK